MSVSAVSGVQPAFQPNPQDTAFRSAITQLTSAIGSGDLATAQKAYSTLTTLQQNAGPPPGAPAGGPNGGQDPFSQLLTKIGGDLSSGDISGAQSDLASFQKAAASHHHHHHGGGGAPPAASSPAAPAATPTSSSNAVDVTA